ncbi:phosphomannomutase [Providencia stuartii]|uniref:Phosphomannomutase n=1 Tax=Providencia stuartii TaxID=588 RepID=A0A1S1HMH2_PROST|nr:phosphomannomutase [Providencia stuartii]OHT22606.1 phosphomannomutase [Providencia stuartii]
MLNSSNIISSSGIQFGTSGARGLVSQFTTEVCAAFTYAFINSIKNRFNFTQIAVAIDNRPSSKFIASACIDAINKQGFHAIYYGVIPTPALAYSARLDKIPCIMVTGSHIPFDRNGLKFYRPDGEITKSDELAILNANVMYKIQSENEQLMECDLTASKRYIERYTSLFEPNMLSGKRIGIYTHSSAGRDIYPIILKKLGAEVILFGRSDKFIPIDTEAVSEEDNIKAREWSKQYQLDAIFSTDGDGDRPLVADENGEWLRGDILGLLCSTEMNIEALAIPINCNSLISQPQCAKKVNKTKIGSPYVIEELTELSKEYQYVAGFEANGGYILGSDIKINDKDLLSLPTRDAVLPFLMLLSAAKLQSISQLVTQLPKRYTFSERIQNFDTKKSNLIIQNALDNPANLLRKLGFIDEKITSLNTIDGLRMTISNGNIIHLRPSGNAPELRCYAEASNVNTAKDLVLQTLHKIQNYPDF